jgi:hypothetical protein
MAFNFGLNVNVSNSIVGQLDTERWTNSTSYIRAKQFTIKQTGTYRISFDLRHGVAGATYNVYGRIYKNDSPYGTERLATSYDFVTFTEDLFFNAGDKCQLFIRSETGGSVYVHTANFRIRASIYATEDQD